MLYTTRINNLVAACPKLSRIWIKTGTPKIPLKAVWINESQLRRVVNNLPQCAGEEKPSALAEDHLWMAAYVVR
jgi:hypothetical protein